MKVRTYVVILGILVLVPPSIVTLLEFIVWNRNPPVGEISGLPSALLALLTVPVVVLIGMVSSLVLKLLRKGSTRSYLLAFIIPSLAHAVFFMYIAIRIFS